jgi:NAD(P)-dependent dehydrogenase (short-subunit alcohol dehydrogenase family)
MPAPIPYLSHPGIGRATAVELSHAGWSVILVARNQRALTDTVLLCSTSIDVAVEPGDVANEDFVVGVFKRATERFGMVYAFHTSPT